MYFLLMYLSCFLGKLCAWEIAARHFQWHLPAGRQMLAVGMAPAASLARGMAVMLQGRLAAYRRKGSARESRGWGASIFL